MTPKEAVTMAKNWVSDIFAEENVVSLTLEEVRFDDSRDHWLITLGLARPEPPAEAALGGALAGFLGARIMKSFKLVRIDDRGGRVLGIENRAIEPMDV